MSRITTLVFDIGNVLSHFSFDGMVTESARFTKCPPEKVREILIKWSRPFCLGELEPTEFAKRCLEDLQFTGSIEDFKTAYNTGFTPNQSMRPVIERYAPHYPLYYLSDTNAWHLECLLQHDPLLPHFRAGTVSFEVESLKPDPSIYEHAARVHEFASSEAIFIDDRPANVAGAEAIGFTGLQYTSDKHVEFEAALEEILN